MQLREEQYAIEQKQLRQEVIDLAYGAADELGLKNSRWEERAPGPVSLRLPMQGTLPQ